MPSICSMRRSATRLGLSAALGLWISMPVCADRATSSYAVPDDPTQFPSQVLSSSSHGAIRFVRDTNDVLGFQVQTGAGQFGPTQALYYGPPASPARTFEARSIRPTGDYRRCALRRLGDGGQVIWSQEIDTHALDGSFFGCAMVAGRNGEALAVVGMTVALVAADGEVQYLERLQAPLSMVQTMHYSADAGRYLVVDADGTVGSFDASGQLLATLEMREHLDSLPLGAGFSFVDVDGQFGALGADSAGNHRILRVDARLQQTSVVQVAEPLWPAGTTGVWSHTGKSSDHKRLLAYGYQRANGEHGVTTTLFDIDGRVSFKHEVGEGERLLYGDEFWRIPPEASSLSMRAPDHWISARSQVRQLGQPATVILREYTRAGLLRSTETDAVPDAVGPAALGEGGDLVLRTRDDLVGVAGVALVDGSANTQVASFAQASVWRGFATAAEFVDGGGVLLSTATGPYGEGWLTRIAAQGQPLWQQPVPWAFQLAIDGDRGCFAAMYGARCYALADGTPGQTFASSWFMTFPNGWSELFVEGSSLMTVGTFSGGAGPAYAAPTAQKPLAFWPAAHRNARGSRLLFGGAGFEVMDATGARKYGVDYQGPWSPETGISAYTRLAEDDSVVHARRLAGDQVELVMIGTDGQTRWSRQFAHTYLPYERAKLDGPLLTSDLVLIKLPYAEGSEAGWLVAAIRRSSGDLAWQRKFASSSVYDSRSASHYPWSSGLDLLLLDQTSVVAALTGRDRAELVTMQLADGSTANRRAMVPERDLSTHYASAGPLDLRKIGDHFEFHTWRSSSSEYEWTTYGYWQRIPAQPSTVRIDQSSLDGGWGDPTRDGQGLMLDYYEDQRLLFGAWFTFQGQAEWRKSDLRWYTISATVPENASELVVSIFNTPNGRFDLGVADTATQVGRGWLRFDSCTSGTFHYRFESGELAGTEGAMPIEQLLPWSGTTCATPGATPVALPAQTGYGFSTRQSGGYYEPATSGQGIMLQVRPEVDLLFGAWFVFDPDGLADDPQQQHWFTLQGNLSTAVNGEIAADIVRTIGLSFDSPGSKSRSLVGRARIRFTGCDRATLSYQFDQSALAQSYAGRQGDIELIGFGRCQ